MEGQQQQNDLFPQHQSLDPPADTHWGLTPALASRSGSFSREEHPPSSDQHPGTHCKSAGYSHSGKDHINSFLRTNASYKCLRAHAMMLAGYYSIAVEHTCSQHSIFCSSCSFTIQLLATYQQILRSVREALLILICFAILFESSNHQCSLMTHSFTECQTID